jgi:hypothetical protein
LTASKEASEQSRRKVKFLEDSLIVGEQGDDMGWLLTSASNQLVRQLALVLMRSIVEFLVVVLEAVEETHGLYV